MKILVTGGAGFIGRYVVTALSADGNEVYSLDLANAFMGGPMSPRIREIGGDMTMRLPWYGIPDELDCVVHLGAVASPGICDNDPALAFNVNVNGTHNVLKLALERSAKRVVFASTAHVYGISPKYMPTDERHPLWLQDTYTTTKLLSEQLCHLFYENHNLAYCILRMFNGYGPGQSLGYFIPDMIEKASEGAIDLRSKDVTKDFVFVNDISSAFVKAVHSTFVGALNIGRGVESTLETVATYIAAKMNAKLTVIETGSTPTRMWCDNTRARRVLDWEPKVSLAEGLDFTIASHKGVAGG